MLDYTDVPPACFVIASVGVLSDGCGHGGAGVCLGDGQTEKVDAATAYPPIPDLPFSTSDDRRRVMTRAADTDIEWSARDCQSAASGASASRTSQRVLK